jgi:TRAP-type C4-dicarboxylate transport system permease small subunit
MGKSVYRINKILEYLILSLLISITTLVFAQVLLRMFASAVIWAEELSRYLFIWLIFLSTALGIKRKAHLSMDMILGRFHGRIGLVLNLVVSIMASFFFLILGYYTLQVFGIWTDKTSPVLGLSMAYVFLSLPVSTGLILLNLAEDMVEKLKLLK